MNNKELKVKAIGILYNGGMNTHDISRILDEDIVYVHNQVDIYIAEKKEILDEEPGIIRPNHNWVHIAPIMTNWSAIAFFLYGHSLAKCNKDETEKLRTMFPEMEKILKENKDKKK